MKGMLPTLLLLCAWALPGAHAAAQEPVEPERQAPRSGTDQPARHAHARHGRKTLRLGDTTGATIRFWHPDLQNQPLQARNQAVNLPRTGVAGYHAVVAEWERPGGKQALIHYRYLHGRPSPHSPRELLAARKTEFEIVPHPLPREHYRYHANERWNFLLRLRDLPVADTVVKLTTEHGSKLEARSDAQGRVSFLLPDDFPQVKPGRRANAPAELTLRADYSDNDRLYSTRLRAAYHADPGHWQSTPLGAGVAVFGLLAGLAGGLRRRNASREAAK